MRPDGAHEIERVLERIAFDVEFGFRMRLQKLGELVHVLRADVPAVGARMNGDAMRACIERDLGRSRDAWDAQRTRVAQQRDLVQVDAEFRHARRP